MKEATRALANQIATGIEVNASDLTWGGYDATLPADVTAEQAKAVNAHNKALVPAITVAFGERAVEVLKENPSFPQVTGTAQFGATKIQTITERLGQRQVGIPKEGQPAEKVPTPGLTSVKVTTVAGKELKDARSHILEVAATKL